MTIINDSDITKEPISPVIKPIIDKERGLDVSVIPVGLYCYSIIDGKQVNCPYYGKDEKNPGNQEDGFCKFLDKSDWDLNDETGLVQGWTRKGHPVPPMTAHELKLSLLWDMCKECGVNNDAVDGNVQKRDKRYDNTLYTDK